MKETDAAGEVDTAAARVSQLEDEIQLLKAAATAATAAEPAAETMAEPAADTTAPGGAEPAAPDEAAVAQLGSRIAELESQLAAAAAPDSTALESNAVNSHIAAPSESNQATHFSAPSEQRALQPVAADSHAAQMLSMQVGSPAVASRFVVGQNCYTAPATV